MFLFMVTLNKSSTDKSELDFNIRHIELVPPGAQLTLNSSAIQSLPKSNKII
jgi:hypothetical protein